MPDIVAKPVTKARWADLERLFDAPGGPKYCWCMAWRAMANRGAATNADRKHALRSRVERRVPIGLVFYAEGEPVAWCSVAPRETFLPLRKDQSEDDRDVWSIVCFFIRRDHRKLGLSARMLKTAVAYAKKRGARAVEAYPVDPDSPSYRFMGFLDLFTAQGFSPTGRAGTRRHIVRRDL